MEWWLAFVALVLGIAVPVGLHARKSMRWPDFRNATYMACGMFALCGLCFATGVGFAAGWPQSLWQLFAAGLVVAGSAALLLLLAWLADWLG